MLTHSEFGWAATAADLVLSPSNHQAQALRRAWLLKVVQHSNVTESSQVSIDLPASDGLGIAWIGRFAKEKRLEVSGGFLTELKVALVGRDKNHLARK